MNLLKRFFAVAVVLALTMSISACGESGDEVSSTPTIEILDEMPIVVAGVGGKVEISYRVNNPVAGSEILPVTNDVWINNLTYTEDKISFDVQPNTKEEPRSGILYVRYLGAKQQMIAINQEPAVFSAGEHDFVDLGLSVKWATCNLGATSPEQKGNFFAWGELEPKNEFYDANYLYISGEYTCENIGNSICGTDYDVVSKMWGNGWRMPTMSELEELYSRCSNVWVTVDGQAGRRFTGPNGNTIFLPAAGYFFESGEANYPDKNGSYWCGDVYDSGDGAYNNAYYLVFSSNAIRVDYTGRSCGHTIRPVHD